MATSELWNINRPQPRALPSGSGQLYFIIPHRPWHNYYLINHTAGKFK